MATHNIMKIISLYVDKIILSKFLDDAIIKT